MIQTKTVEETHNIELFNSQHRTIDDIVIDVKFKIWRDDNYGSDIDGNRGGVRYSYEIIDIDNVRKNGKLIKYPTPKLKMRIIDELEPNHDWFDE